MVPNLYPIIGSIIVGIILTLIGIVFNIVSTKIATNENESDQIINCGSLKKTGDSGRRTGEILILVGYSFFLISLIITISVFNDKNEILLPLITLILIIYKTALTGYFFNKLVKDDIANEYFVYEGLSKFLLLGQLILICILVYNFAMPKTQQRGSSSNGSSNKEITLIIISLFLLNMALTGITNSILVFFSTDG